MRRSGNEEEAKRIAMDLEVLLKCSSCKYIVQCYGYLIAESEVWICMERMTTCFEKLLRRMNPQTDAKLKNESNQHEDLSKELESPLKVVPQNVLGKVAVAVSIDCWEGLQYFLNIEIFCIFRIIFNSRQ